LVAFLLAGGALAAEPPAPVATPVPTQPPVVIEVPVLPGEATVAATPALPPAAELPVPLEPVTVTIERVRFPSDTDRVLADVFIPPGPGPYPVVALLHGAHPRRVDRRYMEMGEDLARNGFLTVFVRVYERGRTGRGTRAQWRRSVGDALTYAATLPKADPSRMGVVGFSLGAFLALEQSPRDPRIAAAVAFYGGITRGQTDLRLEQMPPVLLLHGTADRIVPARRSVEAVEQLRESGRTADLVVYPAGRHGFCLNGRGGSEQEMVAGDAWTRAIAFLKVHLGAGVEEALDPERECVREAWLDLPAEPLKVLINPTPDEVKKATPPPPKRKAAPAKKAAAAPATTAKGAPAQAKELTLPSTAKGG
jgi:carboxymethylenebutenolidase